jgi:hypothetical protein
VATAGRRVPRVDATAPRARTNPGELRPPLFYTTFVTTGMRSTLQPRYMHKRLDDAADLHNDRWPTLEQKRAGTCHDIIEDTWEEEGWYCYCCAEILGKQRVHCRLPLVGHRPVLQHLVYHHQGVERPPLSFRAGEDMLPPTQVLWIHESDYSRMRSHQRRGMRPTTRCVQSYQRRCVSPGLRPWHRE